MNISYKFLIGFLLLSIYSAEAQSNLTNLTSFGTAELDSSIRYGQLSNGLIYYIKPLPKPDPNIHLRFYVKAGRNHQDSDQLDMAHAVEHLAFESSKNFPVGIQNNIERLESMNMSIFNLNGSAGRKATQYTFKAPSGNSKAFNTGLHWFLDIATGLDLTDEDIDKQRGVLIQEVATRTGDNFQINLSEKQLRYALFPGIEDWSNPFEHYRTFKQETLRRFYRDWYRPELMAVSIVGNIEDPEGIEKHIKEMFSNIAPFYNPRDVPNTDSVFYNQSPQFAVVESAEESLQRFDSGVKYQLFFRDPTTLEKLGSLEGIKRLMKWTLLIDILNNRGREKTNVYNKNFDMNFSHDYLSYKRSPALKVNITSKDNSEKKALAETIKILYQMQKYGVSEAEFSETKREQIQNINAGKVENSRYWLDGIGDHYIYGEAFPDNKLNCVKDWLSSFTIEEFTEFIQSANLEIPEDIGIIAPPGHQALSYKENMIRSWIDESYDEKIEPYPSPAVSQSLMSTYEVEKLQEYGYADNVIGSSGARELLLDNGVKIILKSFEPSPGVFENKVLLHGFKTEGASCFSKKDYFSAVNAPQFIKNSGIADINKFQLQRYLSTTSMWYNGITPYIHYKETGIKIDASPEDLEEMLQIVYLYFTKPRIDEAAFIDWKLGEKKFYHDHPGDLKHTDLMNSFKKFTGDSSGVFRGTVSYVGLENTEMEKGYEIYQKLFENAADFTFVVSGNFDIKSAVPLVNKYFGNLSNSQDGDSCISETEAVEPLPKGPIYKEFEFPEFYEKKNVMFLPSFVKKAERPNDWRERIRIEALGTVTRMKVFGLRFEKGFSLYDVSAAGMLNQDMSQYEIRAILDCVPEEFPALRKEFFKIISGLKSEDITKEFLLQSLKKMNHQYNAAIGAYNHRGMQGKLYEHYRYDMPWIEATEIDRFINSLTPQDIRETAKKYYRDENLFEFVMKKNK